MPSLTLSTRAIRKFKPKAWRNGLLPWTTVRHKSGPYGYTQAKALVFSKYGEPKDVLSLHTHSISPSLPAHAVLVRTLAAPINPADINTLQGTYGALPPFSSLLGTPEPAAIPGTEACLEVLATGSAVKGLHRGDWAIPAAPQFGTWRTHALVEHADQALMRISLPDSAAAADGTEPGSGGHAGLTPLQVATVSVNPCSAWRMLRDYVDLVALSMARFRSAGSGASSSTDAPTGGAWFIQNGANSGVGRAAIQLAAAWGLRSINVVRERATPAETDALRAELHGLGATLVVTEAEFLDRSFAARLGDEVTRGGHEPVLLGLNCVGGKSAAAMAKALGEGGTLVTYGAMARQPVALPTGLLIFRDVRFRGFWLSRWARAAPEERRTTVHEILRLMRDGKFREPPVQELEWTWDTEEGVLKEAVQGTLEGFRKGKGVFVFKDT